MGINEDALEALRSKQMKVFYQHSDFLHSSYVGGEVFLVDEALSTEDIYCMVIGEAPGAQEDVRKRPFVGPAGTMLRRLLDAVVIPPAWITNVVKFRPPGNRTPKDSEIELARPYLNREWHIIGRPRTIICCGNVPLRAVTGRGGVLKRAGVMETWPASDGAPIWLWPMVHPSFALRNPDMQPVVDKHWAQLREWLDATYGG